mmetsp:Transcript_6716/g.11962  ORF Transcript_6716/g.11962 Transcript_6716/m.11962 type:complete len:117 (-) Transcript_6716:3684-4034(-)
MMLSSSASGCILHSSLCFLSSRVPDAIPNYFAQIRVLPQRSSLAPRLHLGVSDKALDIRLKLAAIQKRKYIFEFRSLGKTLAALKPTPYVPIDLLEGLDRVNSESQVFSINNLAYS